MKDQTAETEPLSAEKRALGTFNIPDHWTAHPHTHTHTHTHTHLHTHLHFEGRWGYFGQNLRHE